ncbi:MAG TPA: SDR family oxidoreductase [Sideroxyarcus sp.]|nr:SDR family oxidoreductase [Sideroxyarcus sp.]
MTAILVTGANGFVGQALCEEAAKRGLPVRGATRTACQLTGAENVVVGAIDEKTDWTQALAGVDVVIHLAARVHVMHDNAADPLAEFRKVNLHGTVNLARQAARAGIRRLVYVSSIKVNGEGTASGQRYTEQDIPAPQDPYGISKWDAEQALQRVTQETGLEVVIVRPPLVYGPGVKGNFINMLKVLAKGMPLPLASACNLRSLIYVGNLADALLACAHHPDAAGQTYLVSDGEDVSTPELLRRLGAALGRPAKLFWCPPMVLKVLGGVVGKSDQIERLLGSLRVGGDKIRRELNWMPPYTLQQGLQETAGWYRNTFP